MPRRLFPYAAVGFLLVTGFVLGACSSQDAPASDPSSPTSRTSAAAVVTPPRSGACYRLTVAAALQPSNTAVAVPCSRPHTSRTVVVARVPAAAGGRPVAMDSARAQKQIASRCRAAVDRHVGGSLETQRLSRVQAVWFSPPAEAVAQGARWFRCDLVIAGSAQAFATLPKRTHGLLDRADALERYGTCGTAAPGTAGFRRVLCSAKHRWRARATIALPAGSRYLARAVGKQADAQCRDVEARRAVDILRLRWSFEWPTPAQWHDGQRYGLCWTPDP